MPFESITGKTLAALLLLIATTLGGFFYGSHVRGLDDGKAYTALQTSQAKAVLAATDAARNAQMTADAAQLAQQQAATQTANDAATRHENDLAAANARTDALQTQLNDLSARQPTTKTWLSTPIPAGIAQHVCTFDQDGRPSAGC